MLIFIYQAVKEQTLWVLSQNLKKRGINTACLWLYNLIEMIEHAAVCWIGEDMRWNELWWELTTKSCVLILPWPCAECTENTVCGAKDNTAAFVLKENNTADDAALCHRCSPRSHVSFCGVTRPDKVALCSSHVMMSPYTVYRALQKYSNSFLILYSHYVRL